MEYITVSVSVALQQKYAVPKKELKYRNFSEESIIISLIFQDNNQVKSKAVSFFLKNYFD